MTMKFLQDYMEKRQSAAVTEAKGFYAFNDDQVKEELAKYPGLKIEDLTSLGVGLICEKSRAKKLIEDLCTIAEEAMQQDVKENTLEGVIVRELNNHEAYYTGDIESTWYAIQSYPGIKQDYVEKLFRNKKYKIPVYGEKKI